MVASFEAGDVEAYRALFTGGAVVWLSYRDGTMSAAQNAELLRGLHDGFVERLHYEDVRRRRTHDGYVQQHDLVVVAKSGATLTLGACTVVHVGEGDLITRFDDYLDGELLRFGQEQDAAARVG